MAGFGTLPILMVLSIAKIGVAHAEYYTSEAALGAVSYYADGGDHAGVWVSVGGWGMTAGSAVTADDLRAALSARDPLTNQVLGRKYEPGGTYRDALGIERLRRPSSAYDLTYSVPKSISAAWAIADAGTRRQIRAAYDASVEAIVAYMAANAVMSRKGTNGVEAIDVPDGAAVARFDHYTSRAGDPQLHSHLLVMNRVLCSDGKWRTLDGRFIYRHLQAASMYGAAVLRAELSRRLGWNWDRIGTNRHAEVAGVPGDLLAHWSARRRAVEREAQRKVRHFEKTRGREPTPEERLRLWDEATVQTRDAKDDTLGQDLHRGWRSDAIELGHDPAGLTSSYRTAERVVPDRYDRPEVMVGPWEAEISDSLADHVLATVEQHAVGVTDEQVTMLLYSVINASPLMEGAACGRERVDATYEALREQVVARLVSHNGLWYSPGMIAAEAASLSWLAADAGTPDLVAAPDLEGLSDDQAQAVRRLAAARTNGSVVVGPAGAGKTTMLARFAQAVGSDRVVAVAPTAVAAAELGASLGVAADTVAKLLIDPERIPEGAWLFVDEASQLATRELAALCGRAAAAGARVVLVGDYAQQGSVTAGGVFSSAARSGTMPVAALSELWRFSDPAEAAATARLRVGDAAALRYHHRRGRVAAAAHTEVPELVGDWWEKHRDETVLVSAPSQALVREINAEIAGRRASAGETGPAVTGDGDGSIRIGDVITTRRNNRDLVATDGKWVRNGDRWVVEWTLGRGGLRVRRLDDPEVRASLPEAYVSEHVELGYAVTHTRAQSATVDAALTVIGASTRLPELYVGLTRGRHHNQLVVVTDRPAHDEDSPTEHLPPAEIIASVLARGNDQRTALAPHQGTLAAAQAAAHLEAVADVHHRSALPHLEGFDGGAALAASGVDPAAATAAVDLLEQRVGGAIEQWLAGLGGDALYEGLTDAEIAAVNARIEAFAPDIEGDADPDRYDPTQEDLDTLAASRAALPDGSDAGYDYTGDDTPLDEFDYGSAADPGVPYDLPDSWWDAGTAVPNGTVPTGIWDQVPEAGPDPEAGAGYDTYDTAPASDTYLDPAGVQLVDSLPEQESDQVTDDRWRASLGLTHRVADLAVEIVTVAAGGDPTDIFAPYPTGEADNEALLSLVRHYSRAAYVDSEHADRLAALIAAVADTPLRELLADRVDETAVANDDARWANDVRAALLARRIAKWGEMLTALDTLRDSIREQAGRFVAGGAGEGVFADRVADHDRATWQTHCRAWLDSGASPAELLDRWAETDRSLAEVAAGRQQPTVSDPAAHWSHLGGADLSVPPVEDRASVQAAEAAVAEADRPPVEAPALPSDSDAGRIRAALRKATSFYHRQLLHSPEAAEARRYLESRGIGPDDWERWELGWAPDRWQAVTDLVRNDQLAIDAGLAGRARTGRVYDAIRGRIMFPVRDRNGGVVGFSGRSMNPDQPKYVNTARTHLYDKSQLLFGLSHAADDIAETGEAVVVEGYTDVIAAHRNGLTNTVGTGGTAFTDEHAAAIAATDAAEVTVMYDGDPAGRASTRKVCAAVTLAGLPVSVVDLPAGKDPADMDPDDLLDVHRQAMPHLWAQLAAAAERWDLSDPGDAAEAADYMIAIADEDPILEAVAAQQAAAMLSIPLDAILAQAETGLHPVAEAAPDSDPARPVHLPAVPEAAGDARSAI